VQDVTLSPPDLEETRLVERLRAGDEAAFGELVDRHHSALLRVAQTYVSSRAVAEEVVQETWLAVIRGIGRFEGRSSLKTWLFRILSNRAKTRGAREARTIAMSALAGDEHAVDADRFLGADHPEAPGWWSSHPTAWPEERLLAGEVRDVIEEAVEELPDAQRAVIALRDIEGWSSDEACDLLGITAGNQRVLLHRARSRVRSALETYLDEESTP
jgi:RNA polymerase sigma-70 factor (ECF subfamily)